MKTKSKSEVKRLIISGLNAKAVEALVLADKECERLRKENEWLNSAYKKVCKELEKLKPVKE